MKTKTKTTGIRGLFVAGLIILSAMAAWAQPLCDYRIHNTLDCAVSVDVSFSETTPPCVTCPGGLITIAIPANSTYVITCGDINSSAFWGCTNSLCDMSVKMSSPIASASCSLNNWVPLTGLPGGCNATPGAQMDVSASDTNINR